MFNILLTASFAILCCSSASAGVKYRGPVIADPAPVDECPDSKIQPLLDKVADITKSPLKCPAGGTLASYKSMTDVYINLSQSADNCEEPAATEISKALKALQARLDSFENKCGI